VTDMVGGGPFGLKAGEWTDDTSMALCLAASLVERRGFDVYDQMVRYCRWRDEGYMSSNGRCFDIGGTVNAALNRFKETSEPFSGSTDPQTAGNGSIMRLAPIPMFFFANQQAAIDYAAESSRTTHGAAECVDACRLFSAMLWKALNGQPKEAIFRDAHFPQPLTQPLTPEIAALADGRFFGQTEANIKGSGYVVESLEAALWCFYHTENYRDAILKAVNLGRDADTTAAVCGQIAGAYYGERDIPTEWKRRVAHYKLIADLADKLLMGSMLVKPRS
jgi:ADP-ribosyl-[dinitrogen reductase] hydrolase